jgi:hypothetical protein
MVNLKLGEHLIDAAVQKLKDNMDARVAQINDEYQDDVPLHAPGLEGGGARDGSDYYKAGTKSAARSPFVIVAEGPGEFGGEGSEGPHELLFRPELWVLVCDEHPNREILGKKLQRLARAAIESIWDSEPQQRLTDPGGATLAYDVTPERTVPGQVFERDADEGSVYQSYFTAIFRIHQREG